MPVAGVDFLQVVVDRRRQAAVLAVLALPVVDAARGVMPLETLMDPDLLAGGGVERDEGVVARQHVNDVVDDERVEQVRVAVLAGRSRRPRAG